MTQLGKDWITDGLLDFEYKKYVLLAYLKSVNEAFGKVKLYPSLADLVSHYNHTISFRKNHSEFRSQLPKQLKSIDWQKLQLEYEHMAADDHTMKEIENVIDFAIPLMKKSLEEGKEIYEFVEDRCELTTIGLLPLYVDEGYLFINNTGTNYYIYRYEVSKIQTAAEQYRAIHTKHISNTTKGVGETLENIKQGLVKKFTDLPNPATFAIISKMQVPVQATLEPIAKRLLVKYISTT